MSSKRERLVFRSTKPEDWPVVLTIANQSIAGVPGAGSQDEWLENRRCFASTGGVQRHFVARGAESDRLLAFGSVESDPKASPSGFRIFVVTAPSELLSVGSQVLEHALTQLRELGAQQAWFIEYAADTSLLSFAQARGFDEVRRFDWRGVELVVLQRELGSTAA